MDRIRKTLFILLLQALSIIVSSCSEGETNGEKKPPVLSTITAQLYDNGSYSVRILVTHNGSNRDLYYGFVIEGEVEDVYSAVQVYMNEHDVSDLLSSATSQKKQILTVTGLIPSRVYSYIVFGMTEKGEILGMPAFVSFTTEESDIVFAETGNWKICYKGQVDYNNLTYSQINVSVVDSIEERYLFFVAKASEVDEISAFLGDRVNSFNSENETETDKDFYLKDGNGIRTGSTRFYRYLQADEYLAFAVGINVDGSPTGNYAKSDVFKVEGYTLKERYAELVNNNWIITDHAGKSFDVTFEQYYANSWLKMRGWGERKDIPIKVRYFMDTEKLSIPYQEIAGVNEYRSSSDGNTYNGIMYFNGYCYVNEDSIRHLSWSQSKDISISIASFQSDSNYQFVNGYYMTKLDSLIKYNTSTYGAELQFRTTDGSMIFLEESVMRFPLAMKKSEAR